MTGSLAPGEHQRLPERLEELLLLKDAYKAIWWYARFPNHYAGDGSPASPELGTLLLDHQAGQLAAMIRAVKDDPKALELQNRFFDEAEAPLRTPQK